MSSWRGCHGKGLWNLKPEQRLNSKSYSGPHACPEGPANGKTERFPGFMDRKHPDVKHGKFPTESHVLQWSLDAPMLELVANFAGRDMVTGYFEGMDSDPKSSQNTMSRRLWKEL